MFIKEIKKLHEIKTDLETYKYITTDDVEAFRTIQRKLRYKLNHQEKFIEKCVKEEFKNSADVRMDIIKYQIKQIENKIYRSNIVSPIRMAEIIRKNDDITYSDLKKLCEMINCYYKIEQPYKAPNKIAYGWNYAVGEPKQNLELYCRIRNYLEKNKAEYDVEEFKNIMLLKGTKSLMEL